jgi:hypothetical protein
MIAGVRADCGEVGTRCGRWQEDGCPWERGSRCQVWGRFGWGSCRIKKALARQQVVFKVNGPKPNCQSNSCHSRRAQGWCCSCCMQLSRKIWLHNAAAVPWQWSSGLGDEAPWNGKWMERGRLKCHERCWFPGCICWPRVLVCSALCSRTSKHGRLERG